MPSPAWTARRTSRWLSLLALAAALPLTAASITASAAPPGTATATPTPLATPPAGPITPDRLGAQSACDTPTSQHVGCQAIIDTSVHWTGRTWTLGPAPATRPRTAPHT